ncbi:23647_t:CDS:2 [Gigaspora margarita]|uniref:23647_t:CDS:1 n=1 Tax=Gigaspora margarita TaxID=4874 RepID=A0ABN7ULH2_GIGMA|nr:23647_t:CDS:2 [Gigaspora margarita]
MSEKKHKGSREADKAQTESVSRINYCKNELYAMDKRKQQIQPDISEKRPKLQPEPKWDNRFQPRAENEPLLADVGDQLQPMELEESRTVKKIRRKQEPSMIDKLTPYNIIDDILSLPVKATKKKIVKVYMAVENGESRSKEKGEENQVDENRIVYEKLGIAYRGNLEYVGTSQSYANTYQVVTGAKQELIRRKYLRDTGIDLGYTQLLNLQAIKAERAAN